MSEYCLYCCEEKGRPGGCKVCGPGAPGKEVERHPLFLKAGTLLDGRYLVGRVLGHGGFGVTYLGVDVRLGLRVAIKEHLPRELAVRDTDGVSVSIFSGDAADAFRYGLGKFLEEGKALAKFVEHPNIVSVVSFFEENGTGYLVMRYVEGMSLEELRKERGGRLPESETVSLMMAALDGLRAVHKAGMLHRDIKPQNIYYAGETGQVKLLDFGAAREAVSGKSGGLTQLWTQGYAPVEQCHAGGKQGPWTDIYAAGSTMYALLAGETPPDSMDRKLGSTKMKSPGAFPGVNISQKVSSVVMKAMSVESGDRYQNVEDMQRDLMVRTEGNKDGGAGISDGRSESRSGTGFSGGALAQGRSKESVNVAKPVESVIDEGANKKPEKLWHLSVDGRPSSGISLTELRKEIAEGRVKRETVVWNADLGGWTPAGRVKEISVEFPREVQTAPAPGKREIMESDNDLIVTKDSILKTAALVVGSIILALMIVVVGRHFEQAAREQAARERLSRVDREAVKRQAAWRKSAREQAERENLAREGGQDTFRDSRTGLIWQRSPPESRYSRYNWRDARSYCAKLELDGHSDWRLPTIIELRSLIRGCPAMERGGTCNIGKGCMSMECWHSTCSGCSRNQGPAGGCYWPGEMEGLCGLYWSSSPVEDIDDCAWFVYFDFGFVYYDRTSNLNFHVRCVR